MKYVGTDENIKVLKPEKIDTQRYIYSLQQITHIAIALIDRKTASLFNSDNNFSKHKHSNYGTAYQDCKGGN
jgi:hypothetical protein